MRRESDDMIEHQRTLTLDNVHARATMGPVLLDGWLLVISDLNRDTFHVLQKLQEGTCEPWLAPRHEWICKEGEVYVHIENVEPGMLWQEYDRWAALARRGVTALERIVEIISATQPSASWTALAEGADRIRNAHVPIISEGKE